MIVSYDHIEHVVLCIEIFIQLRLEVCSRWSPVLDNACNEWLSAALRTGTKTVVFSFLLLQQKVAEPASGHSQHIGLFACVKSSETGILFSGNSSRFSPRHFSN